MEWAGEVLEDGAGEVLEEWPAERSSQIAGDRVRGPRGRDVGDGEALVWLGVGARGLSILAAALATSLSLASAWTLPLSIASNSQNQLRICSSHTSVLASRAFRISFCSSRSRFSSAWSSETQ